MVPERCKNWHISILAGKHKEGIAQRKQHQTAYFGDLLLSGIGTDPMVTLRHNAANWNSEIGHSATPERIHFVFDKGATVRCLGACCAPTEHHMPVRTICAANAAEMRSWWATSAATITIWPLAATVALWPRQAARTVLAKVAAPAWRAWCTVRRVWPATAR